MKKLVVGIIVAGSLLLGSSGHVTFAAGCQAFGHAVASDAQAGPGNGAYLRTVVPINDEVQLYQPCFCSS